MAHPLDGAGPDLLETLAREAMSSPHAAADPNGGLVVARLLQHLARADSARVAALLWPGDATFAVETHGPGDIVADEVLEGLSAARALVEAAIRSGDPSHSVEMSVDPDAGQSEVIFAARPGEPLRYLFADDVREYAAQLPPVAHTHASEPVPTLFDAPGSEVASTIDEGAPGDVWFEPVQLPSAAEPMAASLRGAIEDALAEMSIQVDLAGISELVRDAVTDQLRIEREFAAASPIEGAQEAPVSPAPAGPPLDPVETARRIAEHLAAQPTDGGPDLADAVGEHIDVLLRRLDDIADRVAVTEQRRTTADAVDVDPAAVEVFAGRVEGELRDLGRRIEASTRREPRGIVGADTRRATRDLEVLTERLESLVRNLNSTVDLRSLGRVARSIERAARLLNVAEPSGTDARVSDSEHRLPGTFERRTRGIAVGDHPLHVVPDPGPTAGADVPDD